MTNKKYLIVFIFLLSCLLSMATGESTSKEPDVVTLTWKDFRELLGLDSDKIKITWAEFRKLLEQTGKRMNIDVRIEEGVVTLKREQFRQILTKMRPPKKKIPPPPTGYLVSEARYKGTTGDKSCRFNASFKIYLFPQVSPGYVNIPILPTIAALSQIDVDGVPAVVKTSGNRHSITLGKSGFHQVNAVFSISHNKQSLSLPVVRSTINHIDFTIPQKDFEINIPSSLNAKTVNLANGTQLIANIPSTNQIKINWNRKIKEKEKKPALFYADTHSLISAAQDIVKVKSTVHLEIIQHSLEKISLQVPKNYEVVKVDAHRISNWHVRETAIGRILEIYFGYDISSDFHFTVYTERILAAETLGVDYSGVQVIDARREKGSIGIVAESAVEVQVTASKELEKLEFHKIPQKILAMSSRPILYSFKYAKHPFHLDIAIDKHERLEGISTVIESADASVLFLEEGKVVYKIIYTIRNTFKQFMELQLPADAGIWTVLVDNKREKASRSKKGKVLIPLVRSPGNGEQLKSFKVELIYTLPLEKFGISGSSRCILPAGDIFINKMQVAMYMPGGFNYTFDKGEWKEEKTPLTKKVKKDVSKKPLAPEEDQDKELEEAEPGTKFNLDGASISEKKAKPAAPQQSLPTAKRIAGKIILKDSPGIITGPAGLDSINVHLPFSGTKYLFSKKIIDKDEQYPLKFSYFSRNLQKGIIYFIILIVMAIAILLILRVRKRKKEHEL